MTRDEFIGKLQMCYFGERNAFNEIISEYDRLNNIINELEKWLKEHSNIDYNCKETIIHEQLALNTAYEYLKELKEE